MSDEKTFAGAWNAALEEAAKRIERMAESYQTDAGAWYTELPEKLRCGYQASVLRYMAKDIRAHLPLPAPDGGSAARVFKTTVLGIGPWCVEFSDGEIITCRTEERARQIAHIPLPAPDAGDKP